MLKFQLWLVQQILLRWSRRPVSQVTSPASWLGTWLQGHSLLEWLPDVHWPRTVCIYRWKNLYHVLRVYSQHAGETRYGFQADMSSRAYLRIWFAPAVASGLSWNLVRSYNGASNKQNRITEIVTTTDLPACVLVNLQMNIVGRANGRGSNSDKPSTPSIPQKANSGITKPNIAASGIRSVRYVCFAYCTDSAE